MKMNTMELNLNEMEMVSGGDATTDNIMKRGGQGAVIGGSVGAAGGSFIPVIGTAGGALIGAATGYLIGITYGFFEAR